MKVVPTNEAARKLVNARSAKAFEDIKRAFDKCFHTCDGLFNEAEHRQATIDVFEKLFAEWEESRRPKLKAVK